MMTVIKWGIAYRWDWTVMGRGLSGEEAAASCISVPSVFTRLIGKTTWLNTFVHTLEKSRSCVLIVLTVLVQKIRWIITYAFTPERSHIPVLFALTVLHIDTLYISICQSIIINSRHLINKRKLCCGLFFLTFYIYICIYEDHTVTGKRKATWFFKVCHKTGYWYV